MIKPRRALLSVSDKQGLVELGRALAAAGAELVATGKTSEILRAAGLAVTPVEAVTGNPEAFAGRMKTLSFQICSGILFRRGNVADEADAARLGVLPIDVVVVNFYPFEKVVAAGATGAELIENIDIGGPTLVRAAAKNAPDVLVLTDPAQYGAAIADLEAGGGFTRETAERCARQAWDRVAQYDVAIHLKLGECPVAVPGGARLELRYGENPHQDGALEVAADSPLVWPLDLAHALTPNALSYNNILDTSAAYELAVELRAACGAAQGSVENGGGTGVVIVKHNNPCGVAWVSFDSHGPARAGGSAQLEALERAWAGDPTSAFGGVLVFTDPLEADTVEFLRGRFVELIAAPELAPGHAGLARILEKRKKLKAVAVREFRADSAPRGVSVVGGRLVQAPDVGLAAAEQSGRCVTRAPWPKQGDQGGPGLVGFGIAVCRALKSNAIALVRALPGGRGFQLVGAGQGQPNRVDAIRALAVPRARAVLAEAADGGTLADCVLVSDAFFPFRDGLDEAARAGVRAIVQPGGSVKDPEVIAAADEHGVAMLFTGVRHFRH